MTNAFLISRSPRWSRCAAPRAVYLPKGSAAQTVVDFGNGAVLARENHTPALESMFRGVDRSDVQQPVVAVGVGAVLVPGGCRGDVAVAVGDDHMGFPCRLVGNLEGDLQGLVGVLGHLRYLEVVAEDLVEDSSAALPRSFYDGAVLANLDVLAAPSVSR